MASDIMARATLCQLADDADELAVLVRDVSRPLPVMPLDPVQREATLMVLLLQARDRARRLLALVASGS
jgi:hypothetical protein